MAIGPITAIVAAVTGGAGSYLNLRSRIEERRTAEIMSRMQQRQLEAEQADEAFGKSVEDTIVQYAPLALGGFALFNLIKK